jgi:hypothetical protein
LQAIRINPVPAYVSNRRRWPEGMGGAGSRRQLRTRGPDGGDMKKAIIAAAAVTVTTIAGVMLVRARRHR